MIVMGFLFLDIESFVDPKDERSGLNPFHTKSKIFGIAYSYYALPKVPNVAQVKKPIFLFEWVEGSEKLLLEKFFSFLENIYTKDNLLKIVGFNHLAYDIPFLFSRMSFYKISSQKDLFDKLFSVPRHVDLAQLGMALSEVTKRDEDFRCISQKTINSYFKIPIKEGTGKDLSGYYLNKRFDLIEKYCSEEFTFELLYNSVLEYFLV